MSKIGALTTRNSLRIVEALFSPTYKQKKMNFSLRAWQLSDLASLVELANNFKIAQNLTDKFPYPYTEANGLAFIQFATSDDPIHIFAIDVNGRAVGGIGIHLQTDVHRKNAELGYWLGESYWGKGIMSAAIPQIVNFGFNTYDISRIFARPFGTNWASQKVLEKNGFLLEAHFEKTFYKNETYLDELVYAVRREKWTF